MEATDSLTKSLESLKQLQKQAESAGELVNKMMAEVSKNKLLEMRPVIIDGKKCNASHISGNKVVIEFPDAKSTEVFFKRLTNKKF